jgi:trigger factor
LLKEVESISDTKKRLTIEIPAEVIESEIQRILRDMQMKAQVPGFRQGKTPMSIIEKKYGKSVEADVLEKLVPKHYQIAVTDAGLKPLSHPQIENSSEFIRNAPLSMTFTLDVMPDLQNLSYEGITIDEVIVEVADAEIEAALRNLAEEKASFEGIDDSIIIGDLVTVDYKTDLEGGIGKDVVLEVGSGSYPQEFHDALVGRKKDEEFEFEAAFPEEMRSQFAGKKVKFNMTISDIKRRNIPSIDEDFAADFGCDNLSDLREKVKESLLSAKNWRADNMKYSQIMDKLIEANNFDLPEGMLNAKINDLIAEVRAIKNDERSDEELRKEVLPFAEKSVKNIILIDFICEKEGIQITEEEMKNKIIDIAHSYRISPDDVVKYYLNKDGSLSAIKQLIYEQKVKSLLLSKAEFKKGD